VTFSAAAYTKTAATNAGVGIHPVIDRGRNGDAEGDPDTPAVRLEAQKIIALIAEAQQQNPAEKIAVLVRARSHLQALVDELRFHEPRIRYQAVEIEPLSGKQVIQDLVALTRALFHLADRVNWLAILRAPWCGLTLADLHALAADDKKTPLWALLQDDARVGRLGEDGQRRLLHMRGILRDAYAHQGRQRPRRWVEGVWQSIGGPLCLRDEGEYADAMRFFELLDTLEQRGGLDLERLDVELEKLFASPDPVAPETIQIMTVHKSKGLEFDTVILPGLDRKAPHNDRPLLAWDEVLGEDNREHLLVAPVNLSRDKSAPAKSDFLYRYEQERAANEMQRLLYVAATRAKRQLHLLGLAKLDKTGETLQVPAKGSCLSLLWDTVRGDFERVAGEPEPQTQRVDPSETLGDERTFRPKLIRVRDPACPLPQVGAEHRSGDGETKLATSQPIDEERGAADVGTLVHRYLEFIAKEGAEHWSLPRIQTVSPQMRAWFQRRDHAAQASEEMTREVLEHLTSTLASADGQWLLRARPKEAAEMALTGVTDQAAVSHIIDRTFVEDGVRWIIDYKTTSANLTPAMEEDELRKAALAFQPQLERYAVLFAASGLPVKIGVFFTRIGRLATL